MDFELIATASRPTSQALENRRTTRSSRP